jgi:hypothetical protein
MRVSNMAVELPLDVLAGPTFDGLDVITGAQEAAADQQAFRLWALLLNHGYRLAATASSDACFDRPGGAVPGVARLYTFIEGDFSIDAAANAAAQGRTFATTGPLLLVSLDGRPPGAAFPAGGVARELRVEAWKSGSATGGLAQVEILRNGAVFASIRLDGHSDQFQTNCFIREDQSAWYCVRASGTGTPLPRAISGAFFFADQPWRSPEAVPARVDVRVVDADTGQPVDATLTEVVYQGTRPRPGNQHRLNGGAGRLAIPATARLRADAEGYEPLTLSPFFDCPALRDFVTGLEDRDLVQWTTFERIRTLLGDLALTFRLGAARPVNAPLTAPGTRGQTRRQPRTRNPHCRSGRQQGRFCAPYTLFCVHGREGSALGAGGGGAMSIGSRTREGKSGQMQRAGSPASIWRSAFL